MPGASRQDFCVLLCMYFNCSSNKYSNEAFIWPSGAPLAFGIYYCPEELRLDKKRKKHLIREWHHKEMPLEGAGNFNAKTEEWLAGPAYPSTNIPALRLVYHAIGFGEGGLRTFTVAEGMVKWAERW